MATLLPLTWPSNRSRFPCSAAAVATSSLRRRICFCVATLSARVRACVRAVDSRRWVASPLAGQIAAPTCGVSLACALHSLMLTAFRDCLCGAPQPCRHPPPPAALPAPSACALLTHTRQQQFRSTRRAHFASGRFHEQAQSRPSARGGRRDAASRSQTVNKCAAAAPRTCGTFSASIRKRCRATHDHVNVGVGAHAAALQAKHLSDREAVLCSASHLAPHAHWHSCHSFQNVLHLAENLEIRNCFRRVREY